MTTIPQQNGSQATFDLELTSVLIGSLPATLLTDLAPDRYVVEAVFSRRPLQEELTELLGESTRAELARSGYEQVELSVSDRRLVIGHTNLQELRDGLAAVLATRLSQISASVRAEQAETIRHAREAAHEEQQRAAAVRELVDSVVFDSIPFAVQQPPEAPTSAPHLADPRPEQTEKWENEGGQDSRVLS